MNEQLDKIERQILAAAALDITELIQSGEFSRMLSNGQQHIDMTGLVEMLLRRAVTREAHAADEDEKGKELLRACSSMIVLWLQERAHKDGAEFATRILWEPN